MLKKYIICLPSVQGNFEEEWEQCLRHIEKTSQMGSRPLKLNIFCDLADHSSYLITLKTCRESIISLFGDKSPTINIIVQPPEKPWKVTVEAVFILSDQGDIVTKFYNSDPYVVIKTATGKEVWGAGLGSGLYPGDTRKAAIAAFDHVVAILRNEDMSLNHIIRQWNYIGNILSVRDGFQNYQIFNEVRSEYYQKYRTIAGFPAATGIGMGLGGVVLDFCAVKADGSVIISAVSNPRQVNAYDYGQRVLKGLADKDKPAKNPPQFERALLITNSQFSTLYISGTASIIGQQTVGKKDVVKQTLVTIENIKRLTDPERLSHITGSPGKCSGNFIFLRVYVKRQKDFGIVKEICNDHFPDVPALFVEADICRDDLLTEIEAELLLKL